MRNLAMVGCLGMLAAASSAQDPKLSTFASDTPAPPKHSPITVTVQPAQLPKPTASPFLREYVPEQLLRMCESQLIDVYKQGIASRVPAGFNPGTVIYKPGSNLAVPLAKAFKFSAWQGKYITCDKMTNRQFGLPTIKADISFGESWIDGGPTLIFDYADASLVWRQYRDEVREVSPGVYLGCMQKREKDGIRVMTWFALDARCTRSCGHPANK
jgi:hypothetical protein